MRVLYGGLIKEAREEEYTARKQENNV